MTENSVHAQERPMLTTRQWIALAVALLALLGLGYCAAQFFSTGTEPPIRVRNGSMDIELSRVDYEWKDAGDSWSPSRGKNSGSFQVKVESANGHACGDGQKTSGKEVWVLYSDKKAVSFKSSGSWFQNKTKVQPRDILQKLTPQLLRYRPADEQVPASAGGGRDAGDAFIVGVGAKDGGTTWSCTFTRREDLAAIFICPNPDLACQ